jgi:hypothetical protein
MVADGILHSAVRVLSFVLDTAIEVAVFPNKEVLIPESDADEDRLTELGSLPSYVETRAQLIPHAWTFESITAETLDRLLSREIGLALYSDALRLRAPNGRFRELWRVLESAFGQKDRCLLASLAKYPPAVKLEYDPEELRKFYILRGRASHAESSAGLSEYHRVSQTVEDFLPRIQSLVQEVLLTKKNWGSRDLSVKRLAPLRSYVKRDGTLVLIPARPGAKQRGN